VSERGPRRFARFSPRERGLPSERAWARSAVLEPRPAEQFPPLISDGGGLPFAPGALSEPGAPLDPADPAVGGLVAWFDPRAAAGRAMPWRRDGAAARDLDGLDGWRVLARTESEVLFGRGAPPRLLTVAVRRDGRRGTWAGLGESAGRPLRAARDGIRASSWRLDPTRDLAPDETTLRLLVTEQTFSGGQRAHGRLQPPDIYVGADEIVLRMFVTPQRGFQARSPNPETPVRVALPHPVGPRELVDGALYEFTS
jgi:hypothetical protein